MMIRPLSRILIYLLILQITTILIVVIIGGIISDGTLVAAIATIGAIVISIYLGYNFISSEIRFSFSIKIFKLIVYSGIIFLYQLVADYFVTGVFFSFSFETFSKFNLENAPFLIGLLIFAPIGEEVIFRGISLEYLLQKKINPVIIVLLISTLFSIGHLPGLNHLILTFILGVFLSIIYLRERNVAYCIIMHFINNLLSLF